MNFRKSTNQFIKSEVALGWDLSRALGIFIPRIGNFNPGDLFFLIWGFLSRRSVIFQNLGIFISSDWRFLISCDFYPEDRGFLKILGFLKIWDFREILGIYIPEMGNVFGMSIFSWDGIFHQKATSAIKRPKWRFWDNLCEWGKIFFEYFLSAHQKEFWT